jgi:hypothetical protein
MLLETHMTYTRASQRGSFRLFLSFAQRLEKTQKRSDGELQAIHT